MGRDISLGGIKVLKNASCASLVRASVVTAVSSAAVLFWSSAAFAAQSQTDNAAEEEDEELQEVQVTGTRIRDGRYRRAHQRCVRNALRH